MLAWCLYGDCTYRVATMGAYGCHGAMVHARRGHMVCTFAVWTRYMATVPPRCVRWNATDEGTDCQRCSVITAGAAEVGCVGDIPGANDLSAKQLISAPVWPPYLYQVGTVSVYRGPTATVRVATVHRYSAQTRCTVTVWPWYTHAVGTRYVQLPCGHGTRPPCHHAVCGLRMATVSMASGHGVRVLWPHGNRSHGVGTVSMPGQYVRLLPCGHGIYTKWARCPCTVATRQP